MKHRYEQYQKSLAELSRKSILRRLPPEIPRASINLSGNDYLGLATDSTLRKKFYEETEKTYPEALTLSASSSRLLSGNHPPYPQLEKELARLYARESALYCNSGYHANTGILPALAGREDLILADKLIHASLVDGSRLSRAKTVRYRHLDYAHLESLLARHRSRYRHVFIVTESIFSMDGDTADLPRLAEIRDKYEAFLYVDEAHAVGVRGKRGLGLAEEMQCLDKIDLLLATSGKALASVGAYLVCDRVIHDYLVNSMRTLIYTTALPPVNIAWTRFIIRRLPELGAKRRHLAELSRLLSRELNITGQSQIIPVIIGSNEAALAAAEKLQSSAFHVLPIRHPTVPAGTARLRLSLHAGLEERNIKELAEELKKLLPDNRKTTAPGEGRGSCNSTG